MPRSALPLVLLGCILPTAASGDGPKVDFSLRMGSASLRLQAAESTPVLGGYFAEATDMYNQATAAYNAAHGLPADAPSASRPIETDDLSMRASLFLVVPSLAFGGEGYVFRLDVPVGLGDGLTTVGAGIYPLGGSWPVGRAKAVAITLAAGAVASWVSLHGAESGAGGLVQGRLAAGTKVRLFGDAHATFELGYTVRALGGVVDKAKLNALESYDPRGPMPPPPPGDILRGGDQTGMLDAVLGVEF